MSDMIIAIDFDGTIVAHEYPEVGAPAHGAIEALQAFQEVVDRLAEGLRASLHRRCGVRLSAGAEPKGRRQTIR